MSAARLGAMLVLCVLAAETAWGQSLSDLHLGIWNGSFKADYELENNHAHAADGSPDIDSRYRVTREGVTVRNEGFYFIDPRLAVGNLGLTFDLVQERETTDDSAQSRNGKLTGYQFDSVILDGFPYNGQLYANRNENLYSQPFSRTETAFENRGLVLRLREDSPLRRRGFPYLSANARLEQQHLQETTTSVTGQVFRNDERQNTLKLDAHNGLQTGDLDLGYEANQVENIAPGASFDSQLATLRYSQDFGPTLNRRSDSHLSDYIRTGANPSRVFVADELLRIDHYSNLSSAYSYLLTHTDTVMGTTMTQDEGAQLQHELYKNLTTTARIKAQQQQLPSGTRDNFAGQLDLGYRRNLPWGGTVSARAGGRHQLDDNRLQAAQISVTDEAQTAPASLGAGAGFLLNQPFVTASSIVVVDTRGGGRLPTTAGTDYEVSAEGSLARIIPLPTSAVIRAGDSLLISYVYEVDPSIRYTTNGSWIGGAVDFHWIALSLDHQRSDQTLVSGQDSGFLQDIREDKAQMDLRGDWKATHGTATAAYKRYDSTRLVYTEDEYTVYASYQPTSSLTLVMNLDRTLIDYTLPVRETDGRSAQLTLDYYVGGWTTTGMLARRIYIDSLQPEETLDEARLGTRLIYGKLTLAAALTAGRRARGVFQTSNWGLNMTAVRQF